MSETAITLLAIGIPGALLFVPVTRWAYRHEEDVGLAVLAGYMALIGWWFFAAVGLCWCVGKLAVWGIKPPPHRRIPTDDLRRQP